MKFNYLFRLIKKQDEYNDIEYILEQRKMIRPRLEALRVSLIYGFLGALWILASDEILSLFITDTILYKQISIYKGWFYVLLTMILLYLLIRDRMSIIKRIIVEVYGQYEELSATNEELVAMEEELKNQYIQLENYTKELSASEERYTLAVEGAKDGIWDWDLRNNLYFYSIKNKIDVLSIKEEKSDSYDAWIELLHPEDCNRVEQKILDYFAQQQGQYQDTFRVKTQNGDYRWVLSKGQGIWDDAGKIIRIAGSHTDITSQMEMEKKLYNLAYYDGLTGLPNRMHFKKKIDAILDKDEATDKMMALVYLDIDNFKHVNDILSHTFGDCLLKFIGELLEKYIKAPNILSRLSGDEFAIFFSDVKDEGDVTDKLEKLLKFLRRNWVVGDQEFFISVSAGVAVYPRDGFDSDTLFKNADVAMFDAKDRGKDRYSLYTPRLNEMTRYYIELMKELRYAIKHNELSLNFQTQIDIKTNEIIGIEVLIRWKHSKKGFISPMEFIPLAEKSGYIQRIEKWVINEACNQYNKWQKQGIPPLKMSVNLSGISLIQNNMIEYIAETLRKYNISTSNFQIEITETAVMNNLNIATENINKLKGLGIDIALDDFGTGYSSLNYLKELPIDVLKIDRSFVSNISIVKKDEVIIEYLIQLAHSLKLKVVAEGIETLEQLNYFVGNGCDIGQGYFFGKPIPADEIELIFLKNKILV